LNYYKIDFPYIETDELLITAVVGSNYFKGSRIAIAIEEIIKKLVELL
jgi:hypothetical protein